MHECDVMVCVGARFDDRVTGRLSGFAPNARKIHIDIDPSSINKNVAVDIPIVGDAGVVLEQMLAVWKAKGHRADPSALATRLRQIEGSRARKCLAYRPRCDVLLPPYPTGVV